MDAFKEKFLNFISRFWVQLLFAVLALVVSALIIKLIITAERKILRRAKIERGAASFIVKLTKAVLWIAAAFIAGLILGIPSTALIAVVTAATVAVGLALQNALGNLASGMLIAVTKPFKVDDYVDIADVSGTVTDIKLFNTLLTTIDNKRVIVPNGTITSENIINYTDRERRMINLTVPVSYKADLDLVQKLLEQAASECVQVIKEQPPLVRVHAYKEHNVNFILRCWTATEEYWEGYWWINKRILEIFGENGICFPYNQLDVHVKSEQSVIQAEPKTR